MEQKRANIVQAHIVLRMESLIGLCPVVLFCSVRGVEVMARDMRALSPLDRQELAKLRAWAPVAKELAKIASRRPLNLVEKRQLEHISGVLGIP